MENLALAIKTGLPLLYVQTDDVINVETVLTYIAGEQVHGIAVPIEIQSISALKMPSTGGRVFYTSTECKSLAKLYNWANENDLTIIFVNTDKSVLFLDCGVLIPPKELIRKMLIEQGELSEELVDEIMPAFGGLTMKDAAEVARLTMTRDESISLRGVNETRRGFLSKLRGIQQVDTDITYYVCPETLDKWMSKNKHFFLNDVSPELMPRGLLFDGPPGTGKTLGAKHVADAFGVPLYRIDLGSMMGKYVGESENNLNAALQQVDQVEPCVVIFDEVEKIFDSGISDSGVTSRLLSQLLWWLQEHKSKVFTVMTTNQVDKIPAELHREGRIDQTLTFLGLTSFTEAYAFAKGVFDNMAEKIGLKPEESHYSLINKRVKTLTSDGPLAQATAAQEVYSIIKDVMSVKED